MTVLARKITLVVLVSAAWATALAHAAETSGSTPLQYNRDIRPILAESCFACHGPDSAARKANLRLDQRQIAVEMQAIVPENVDESTLLERINSDDPEIVMPPPSSKKVLTAAQKERLKQWIASGAEYQPHWSFIPPTRSTPPPVKQTAWIRNPFDAFVLAMLESKGLSPAPEADRRTLARRLSLDLVGLPPTPELVEAFVNDPSADAYEKFVDQLLASPHWGEHRGRYWLDVARYADTHGMHFDNYREMWMYRDWVISAFNRNQPFDQFTIEQLAGDLLPNRTQDQQVASGFNRCNMTTNEGGAIPEEYLVLYTRDRVETVSQVWLGLTAGCAVCHDHKFDPLSQRAFYEMAAFFNNNTQGGLDGNIRDTPPIVRIFAESDKDRYPLVTKELAEVRGQAEARRQGSRSEFNAWLATATPNVSPELEKSTRLAGIVAKSAGERSEAEINELFNWWLVNLDANGKQLKEKETALAAEEKKILDRSTVTHVMQERNEPAMAFVLERGDYEKPKDQVTPHTPDFLPPLSADSAKNRLGFAEWLLRPEHPLTARVTVNRFWQEVFGAGIVRTAGDFGISGELPENQALLDWLAVEFRESGWDVKKFFKLMVTSATYRQSAVTTPEKLELDPQIRLWSRAPRFRMDAEMIRDYALAASGLLVEKIGGPSVKPYQPEGVWEAVAMKESDTHTYHQDSGEKLYRRSMYTFWKRAAPPASMEAFNAPNREVCTVRRERTNTPLQALVTMNDPQLTEAARRLAENVLKATTDDDSRLDGLARRLLSRPLRAEETRTLNSSLAELRTYYDLHKDDATKLISVGESKPDAVLPPDILAAWTMLANELMNVDEVLKK